MYIFYFFFKLKQNAYFDMNTFGKICEKIRNDQIPIICDTNWWYAIAFEN